MTTMLKRIRMYAKTPDIFDSPLMWILFRIFLDTSEIGVKKIVIQAYLLLDRYKRLINLMKKTFLHVHTAIIIINGTFACL